MFITRLFKHWTFQVFAPGTLLRTKYNAFKELLTLDDACLERIADIEEIAYGQVQADWARMKLLSHGLVDDCGELAECLRVMSPTRYLGLSDYLNKIAFYVRMGLDLPEPDLSPPHIISLADAADLPAQAGGKAHKTGLVSAETYLNVPPGFVVTATAFNYFLEYNGLRPAIDQALSLAVLDRPADLARTCDHIRTLILEAPVPEDMADDMLQEARAVVSGSGKLAVRSSAVGEDDELSFAGQYDSVLDVEPDNVSEAYKQVLASKYSVRAVSYRILYGLPDEHTPMAVLVMAQVLARAAGVIYTRDRDRARTMRGVTGIYAVSGTGDQLVSGRANPEIWSLTGEEDPLLLQEPGQDSERVLESEQAHALAKAAYEVEEVFGAAQDIEWVLDEAGELFVVQARPLRTSQVENQAASLESEPDGEVLAQDCVVASGGVGAGVVQRIERPDELDRVEPGAVLSVPALWPALAAVAQKASAVVSQAGSRASHCASVAREMGLPVLVLEDKPLPEPGVEVTVDGLSGRIFAGRVDSLLAGRERRRPESLTLARLEKVLPFLVKLNLTDPEAENFTPEGCRSLHDVVRFCHEKAVAEMFSLVGKSGRGLARAKKLASKLPIVLYVLDVDQGLFETAREKKEVVPDDIKCPPMWALWTGLSGEEALWDQSMPHMDWEEFDRVSGGIFKMDSKLLASYAVLARDYMHLMIRFGYHFSQVDALSGPDARSNYVNFRFKGGGGDETQRELRVSFLRTILEEQGFTVQTRGDLLDASFARESESSTQRRLEVLGRLLACTRLMDMGLTGPEQVAELAAAFNQRLNRARTEF